MRKMVKVLECFVLVAVVALGVYISIDIYSKENDESEDNCVNYQSNENNGGTLEEEEENNIIVVLDPGHGGADPGAMSESTGLEEKDIAYDIALACKERLEENGGFTVYLTREDMSEDEPKLQLAERADIAKEKNADILISFHLNATDYGSCSGATTYSTVNTTKKEYHDDSLILATSILNEICGSCGLENLGAQTKESTDGNTFDCDGTIADNYGIIKGGIERGIPTILIEHGYIDSDIDIAYFDTSEERQQVGYADAEGIIKYYENLENTTETTDDPNSVTTTDNRENSHSMDDVNNKANMID